MSFNMVDIPADIWQEIISHLELEEIFSSRTINKYMKNMIDNGSGLWLIRLKRIGSSIPDKASVSDLKRMSILQDSGYLLVLLTDMDRENYYLKDDTAPSLAIKAVSVVGYEHGLLSEDSHLWDAYCIALVDGSYTLHYGPYTIQWQDNNIPNQGPIRLISIENIADEYYFLMDDGSVYAAFLEEYSSLDADNVYTTKTKFNKLPIPAHITAIRTDCSGILYMVDREHNLWEAYPYNNSTPATEGDNQLDQKAYLLHIQVEGTQELNYHLYKQSICNFSVDLTFNYAFMIDKTAEFIVSVTPYIIVTYRDNKQGTKLSFYTHSYLDGEHQTEHDDIVLPISGSTIKNIVYYNGGLVIITVDQGLYKCEWDNGDYFSHIVIPSPYKKIKVVTPTIYDTDYMFILADGRLYSLPEEETAGLRLVANNVLDIADNGKYALISPHLKR